MPLQYYIGTSGWHYEHWRGRFYPEKLTKAKWLEFYVSHFTTVELNNSFYRLPSEAAFATWHDFSPANFIKQFYDSAAHIPPLLLLQYPVEDRTIIEDWLQSKRGSTLEDAAADVHKDFAQKLKYARIWGSGKHDGLMVKRDHILQDGDIIELHL